MKKIILSILILLVLAGGGTAYYFLKVKTYDISQDAELQEIVADGDYDIVLPPEESSTEGTTEGKTVNGDTPQVTNPLKENGNLPEETPNDGTEKPKVTVSSIKDKYRPSFESLESQANGRINALIGRAIGEYKDKKANGEKISVSYFLTKYKTAGEALEAKTDQAFEQLYSALQRELKKNGFDPNEAADVRSSYESAKKERRNALLSRAMENM